MPKNQGRNGPGEKQQQPGNFGEIKNLGRNASFPPSGGNPTPGHTPGISNSTGRARSHAVTTAPGFLQHQNEGRSRSNALNDTPPGAPNSPGTTNQAIKNQGRNSFLSAQQNRQNLTPQQQTGFNLVSNFMHNILHQDSDNNDRAPGTRQRSHAVSSNPPGFASQQQEQEQQMRRQQSMQSARGQDDESVTAADFFKRLSSAIADPEGFRKAAAQRAQLKQGHSASDTFTVAPRVNTRARANSINEQSPGRARSHAITNQSSPGESTRQRSNATGELPGRSRQVDKTPTEGSMGPGSLQRSQPGRAGTAPDGSTRIPGAELDRVKKREIKAVPAKPRKKIKK